MSIPMQRVRKEKFTLPVLLFGLDYVSCSPFRVPIARLAAAQAAINNK